MNYRHLLVITVTAACLLAGIASAKTPAVKRPGDGASSADGSSQRDPYRDPYRDAAGGRYDSQVDGISGNRNRDGGVPLSGPISGEGSRPHALDGKSTGDLFRPTDHSNATADGTQNPANVDGPAPGQLREMQQPIQELARDLKMDAIGQRKAEKSLQLYIAAQLRRGQAQPEATPRDEPSPRDNNAEAMIAARRDAAKPDLRREYQDSVRNLSGELFRLVEAGADRQVIAETLHRKRRELGEKYKNLTPPDLLNSIYARNERKYGDRLGPSIAWLAGKNKTWEQIIDASMRPGPWPMMQFGDTVPPRRDAEPARQRPEAVARDAAATPAEAPFMPDISMSSEQRARLKAQADNAIALRLAKERLEQDSEAELLRALER